MLDKFAAFLGTTWGFALTMGLTVVCCGLAFVVTDVATFALSVVAIILPSVILVRDNHSKVIADERDKAMHKKLDGLIAGVDKADNTLQQIEPDTDG